MSPTEFVTYLNGAVELGKLSELNNNDFNIVNQKLQSVKNETNPEGVFCTWLKGFMESSENSQLSANQFSKVATKLYDVVQAQSVFNKQINTNAPISKLPKPDEDRDRFHGYGLERC